MLHIHEQKRHINKILKDFVGASENTHTCEMALKLAIPIAPVIKFLPAFDSRYKVAD